MLLCAHSMDIYIPDMLGWFLSNRTCFSWCTLHRVTGSVGRCWSVGQLSPSLLATPTNQDIHTLPEEEGRSELALPLVEAEICESTCS